MNRIACTRIFRTTCLQRSQLSGFRRLFDSSSRFSSSSTSDNSISEQKPETDTHHELDLAPDSDASSSQLDKSKCGSSAFDSPSRLTTTQNMEEVDEEDEEEQEDEEDPESLVEDQYERGFPRISKVFKSPPRGQRFIPQDVMKPDVLMDLYEVEEFPPEKGIPWSAKVIVRNDPSMFLVEKARRAMEQKNQTEDGIEEDEESMADAVEQDDDENSVLAHLPVDSAIYRFSLLSRRVTQQTGKGKIHRQYVMMVVGNGNGLVGMGEGKAEEATDARTKAFAQAVRNMDYVERFEDRTIWTDLETKLGSTRILMRPRPVGFGLHCNPNIHQVLKAAGIKDISAKVWGSRNPLNVIKATFRMIQAGHAPLAMGDGIGGPARKLNKGSGVVGKQEVERMRGRKLVDLRA
jgi:small subunit ribosomal protein S5